MLVAWIATIYGLWQLIELHEIKGRRFNRYHELGQYALGKPRAEHAPGRMSVTNYYRFKVILAMLGYTVLTVDLSKPPTDLKAQCCHARCQPSSKMQLCNLHSRNRSHQAARVCCFAGPRLGLWTVIPCQLIVMIGLDIVYCVTAGKAMYYVYQHTCDGYETHTCRSFGLSCWIVIFAVIQMFLSMVSLCQLNLYDALPAFTAGSQTAPHSRL